MHSNGELLLPAGAPEVFAPQTPGFSLQVDGVDPNAGVVIAPSGPAASLDSDQFGAVLSKELETAGSPALWLQNHYTPDQRMNFALALRAMLPLQDDIEYFDRKDIPSVPEERRPGVGVTSVELLTCGFDKCCSFKPGVSKAVAKQLLGEYLVDGFVTADDPLRIRQPVDLRPTPGAAETTMSNWLNLPEDLPTSIFSLAYIKGMARSSMALFVAGVCLEKNIDLKASNLTLWNSLRVVWVVHEAVGSDINVVMRSAKLSVRGSIRRPYNCIEWAVCLRHLKKYSEESSVVKTWNKQASSDQKLQGRKYSAVNMMLTLSTEILDAYINDVQSWGWENTWMHEDALGEKKLHVGAQHGCHTAEWGRRLRVTVNSELLMIKHCNGRHVETPATLRKKIPKESIIVQFYHF
jgi:hypothetical protein